LGCTCAQGRIKVSEEDCELKLLVKVNVAGRGTASAKAVGDLKQLSGECGRKCCTIKRCCCQLNCITKLRKTHCLLIARRMRRMAHVDACRLRRW
jgi:hypothetical protein